MHKLLSSVEFVPDGSRRKISGTIRGRSYHHDQWHYDIMDNKAKLHMNVPASNISVSNPRGSYENPTTGMPLLRQATA